MLCGPSVFCRWSCGGRRDRESAGKWIVKVKLSTRLSYQTRPAIKLKQRIKRICMYIVIYR